MIPILTAYTFSIKSHHSYPSTFPISSPIVPLYRLSIVGLYRRQYTFPIRIAYKIIYKGPLYFDIPDVITSGALRFRNPIKSHVWHLWFLLLFICFTYGFFGHFCFCGTSFSSESLSGTFLLALLLIACSLWHLRGSFKCWCQLGVKYTRKCDLGLLYTR
jgi:hypothetical protein